MKNKILKTNNLCAQVYIFLLLCYEDYCIYRTVYYIIFITQYYNTSGPQRSSFLVATWYERSSTGIMWPLKKMAILRYSGTIDFPCSKIVLDYVPTSLPGKNINISHIPPGGIVAIYTYVHTEYIYINRVHIFFITYHLIKI